MCCPLCLSDLDPVRYTSGDVEVIYSYCRDARHLYICSSYPTYTEELINGLQVTVSFQDMTSKAMRDALVHTERLFYSS